MLSRIAESLYWIGRYAERAEGTARLLGVHQQLVVEDPWVSEESACRSLILLMGCPPETTADLPSVLQLMAYDPQSPWSIVRGITAARENARSAREVISSDLWESLNSTWLALPSGRFRATDSFRFFTWVRDRMLLFDGVADATLSRDEGWLFMTLGRSVERADMTARLVTTAALSGGSTIGWQSVLRSCGGQEAFVRTYRGLTADAQAAEFLVLDRLFPRSVVFALTQAESCLTELGGQRDRTGVVDEAHRVLGRIRTDLQYRPMTAMLDGLAQQMAEVQQTCAQANDLIAQRYFSRSEAPVSWSTEQGSHLV